MNEFSAPMFSILIPAYNRPELLEKTIRSIFQSTYRNFELIISNDLSENSNKISQLFSNLETDFVYFFFDQTINLGSAKNKNFLLSKASGKFCILIGDDDILLPNSLETLAKFINSSSNEIDIYGMGYNLIDENGSLISSYKTNKELLFHKSLKFKSSLLYEGVILPFWFFHPFTVCIRNNKKLRLYREDIGIGYDFAYLYDCMIDGGKILVLPFIFFNWRKSQLNLEYQNLSNVEMNDVKSRVLIFKNFFIINCNTILDGDYNLKSHFKKFVCYTLFINNFKNYSTVRDFIVLQIGENFGLIADNFKQKNDSQFAFIYWRLIHLFQAFRLVGFSMFFTLFKAYLQKRHYLKK